MENVVNLMKNFENYVDVNSTFLVEVDGVTRQATTEETHTLIHQIFDTYMNSTGSKFKFEDGRVAKVSMVGYEVDGKISVFEKEETA